MIDSGARGPWPRIGFAAFFVVGLAVLVLASLAPIAALPLHVSTDYSEGWNAYWAQAARRGTPLYAITPGLAANNYPPLSFYIVGALGGLVGDDIVAGRIVAMASLIGTAGLIALLLRRLDVPRRWAAAFALLFLLYDLLYFSQFFAVDNPQWLGQLLMLAALVPLFGRPVGALRRPQLLTAATLMILAGLVKHNQLAVPIAVTVWLLTYNRRAFALWCGIAAGLAAAACLLLYALFGPALFAEVIGYRRAIDLRNFMDGLSKIGCLAAFILIGIAAWHRQRGEPRVVLLALYALLALVFGLAQRLGAGIALNAQFDALVALTLLCGSLLGRAAGRPARPIGPRGRALLLALLCLPLALIAGKHVRASLRDVARLPDKAAAWQAMIADVRSAPDPVVCEMLAACYWAGKPMGMDVFAYGQRLRTGLSPIPLERAIAARTFPVMILQRDADYAGGAGRLPQPLPALIDARYRVTRTGPQDLAVMRPRAMEGPR